MPCAAPAPDQCRRPTRRQTATNRRPPLRRRPTRLATITPLAASHAPPTPRRKGPWRMFIHVQGRDLHYNTQVWKYAACASRERFAVDRPLHRAWAIATPHPTPSVDGHAPVSRPRPVARPSPATRGWTHPRPVRPTRDPFAVDSHACPTHRRPRRYPGVLVDGRPLAPTADLALSRATCPTRLDESHARVKDTQRRVRDPSMRLSQIRFLQNTFFVIYAYSKF